MRRSRSIYSALLFAGLALAVALFASAYAGITPRSIMDTVQLRLQADPAESASYDWPTSLEFDAPLDLPHINNYPAFARIGTKGTVHWKAGTLGVQLHEVSHAKQRNVWFDCKAIHEVRVGLTRRGFYMDDHGADMRTEFWSEWQAISAVRTGPSAFNRLGSWDFEVPAPVATKPWTMRLAVEAKCTVRDGKTFNLKSYTPAWFLATAAHQQARAPDPCAQPFSLRDALAARCPAALQARLTTPWGRHELKQVPHLEASWLDAAIAEKLPEALRPLVKAGIDVNSASGNSLDTALIYAAGNGDAQSVRELLMLGARKDQKDKQGFSAYNAAALSGFGDLAMELAEQGVQRDANTGDAYTALSLAAYYGDVAAVRRLLESGSNPDLQVNGWANALHHAVRKDNEPLVRELLAGGSNPNVSVTARRGETPLMIAAENGNTAIMEILIKMGARIDTIDKMGKNATDYAEFFRKKQASDYLCKRGLEPTSIDGSARNGETAKRASCSAPSVANL